MRICRVDVERFLGFKNLSLEVDSDLQLVAGPNNAGKSSLIRLLELFFSAPSSDELTAVLPLHEYYSALGPRTLSSIQVWFTDLSAEESKIFESVLRADGRMWISLRCGKSGSLSYRGSRKASAEESQLLYEELLARIHFVKIPSVRVGGSGDRGEPESLERLLDTLEAILVRTGSRRSTTLQQEFAQKISPVEALVRDVLNQSAAAIMSDLPFQEKTVKFRLPEPRHALRGMLESAVIESTGDVDVPVSERGTGFQSALVLGILRYVASRQSQSAENLIFAIEEPEAFLHPQTQRAMAKIIGDISDDHR